MNLGLVPLRRVCAGLASALVLAAGSVVAAPDPNPPAPSLPRPDREVLAFDRFVSESGAVCSDQPGAFCVDRAWAYANRDGDRGLSVEELQGVRDAARAWANWRADDLYAKERSLLAFGFLVIDGLGVPRLHGLYDADGDGLVDREELLADVRLDERPLGEVLLDRDAVDRAGIAARLGLPPALLDRLQP